MPSISLCRHLVSLTLAAFITLPSLALAAPRAQARPQAMHATFASQVWSFLQRLWGEGGVGADPDGRTKQPTGATLTHVSGAAGMLIDPNGSPNSSPTQAQPAGDAGMLIDPDGAH